MKYKMMRRKRTGIRERVPSTKAIVQIVSGQAKGDTFALFASTYSRFLEPQVVDINAKIDGKKVGFLCQVL